jgi:recombination protein RecT
MSNSLALSNQGQNLQMALMDQLGGELRGVLPDNIKPERMILTIVQCGERNPALYECIPQSLQLAALSMGTLNLECDGFTGQGYLLPFKRHATPVIGYKGYNTLAARNGFTITGGIVRDGDRFEYELGTNPHVAHTPMLRGHKSQIVAAWACAMQPGRAPIIRVLGFDELGAVKAKSPGAKRRDSPWNDQDIGFPAMCEKTAKRRLARDVPLGWVPIGDTLEGCWERDQPAAVRIMEEGPVVTLEREYAGEHMKEREAPLEGELASAWQIVAPGFKTRAHNGPSTWGVDFQKLLHRYAEGKPDKLEELWKANESGRFEYGLAEPDKMASMEKVYEALLNKAD